MDKCYKCGKDAAPGRFIKVRDCWTQEGFHWYAACEECYNGETFKENEPLSEVTIHKTVDIHRIINEAMEKKDRYVTIFISDMATSVNVYPTEDKPMWIPITFDRTFGDSTLSSIIGYRCSECGSSANKPTVYCSECGEKMHGVKKLEEE